MYILGFERLYLRPGIHAHKSAWRAMRAAEKTEKSWRFHAGPLVVGLLVLVLALPGTSLAQVEEEELQQESLPPMLLLSNADNFYRIALDRVQTQSGDPTTDFNEAISYFNRYLEADTAAAFQDSARVYVMIADSYYTLSEWAESNGGTPVWPDAIRYYEWLIEREPPGEDIAFDHFRVAYAKSRLEGWGAGTPHLEKYLELRPEDLERRIWVARIYLSLMDNNRALDHFLIYLAANPTDDAIVTEILNLRIRLTLRYEEITLKLIEHRSDTPKYLHDIADFYLDNARFDEGRDYLLRYLEKEPEDVTALKRLGDEYKRLGQWDNALNAYRQILSVEPHDIQAICDMGEVYLETDRIDNAIAQANRALRIDPDSPYANKVMGDTGQRWAMREYQKVYPGRPVEEMKYDFKTLMKKIADDYYEKAKVDPQFRTHAQNQINYLTQFFPQPQDRFMWPQDKDHIIPFPPPR